MMAGMAVMRSGWVVAAVLISLGASLGPGTALAQRDDEGPMSSMHFVVVRDWNGKPIRNAAVVLHPVTKKGRQAMGGLELKTDEEGKTAIEGIPYGPLRVQVLAEGFQTFGDDYLVNQAEMLITVKMKRPARQYTTYGVQEKKPGAGKDGGSPQEQKPQ